MVWSSMAPDPHSPWLTTLIGVAELHKAISNWHTLLYVLPSEPHTGSYIAGQNSGQPVVVFPQSGLMHASVAYPCQLPPPHIIIMLGWRSSLVEQAGTLQVAPTPRQPIATETFSFPSASPGRSPM